MSFNKKLSIIIPAHNEEKTIINVVKNCNKFGYVILINDCSIDNTSKILSKLKLKNLSIISNKYKLGYDGAINKGVNFALKKGFKFIITYDADNQFYHSDIKIFLKSLDKGFQIVLGVRPYKQRLAEYLFAFFLNKKFGIKDPFCGLKGYDSKIFKDNKNIFTYNSIGTEVLLKNIYNIKRIKQIKIKLKVRLDKPRFGNILTANIKLLLAMFNGFRLL